MTHRYKWINIFPAWHFLSFITKWYVLNADNAAFDSASWLINLSPGVTTNMCHKGVSVVLWYSSTIFIPSIFWHTDIPTLIFIPFPFRHTPHITMNFPLALTLVLLQHVGLNMDIISQYSIQCSRLLFYKLISAKYFN